MLQGWANSLLALVYPPLCLHCRNSLDQQESSLCKRCLKEIVFLDPFQHCSSCFSPIENDNEKLCMDCRHRHRTLKSVAAAFSYEGPVATLVKKLKYGNQPYLAESIAAWMVIQWEQLSWPMPDVIVPVPISWARRWDRGYNQSFLIAEAMGKILNLPVYECLKRRSDTYSQAGLTKSQRLEQASNTFYLSTATLLQDKTILLIDDVMTSGTTLTHCGEALAEGYPSAIYALTFCKAE